MANADFGPWLKNNTSSDEALSQLKLFAEAHGAEWPYHSNRITDYVRVVLNAHDPKEDVVLASLERYFNLWRGSSSDWWNSITAVALIIAGLVVAAVVGYALFYTELITKLAYPENARGLITFLFSFVTVAVIVIVIIALLWMDKDEDLENRFSKAKDIIAILIGILGTIVGFYFGSNSPGTSTPGRAPTATLPTVTRPGAAPSSTAGSRPEPSPSSAPATVTPPVAPEPAPAMPR